MGRLGAGLASLALCLGGFGLVPPASATPVVGTVISDDDEPTITITSVGGSTLAEGDDLRVDVTVANPGSETLSISSLSLFGNSSPLSSRTTLMTFMEGGGGALTPLHTETELEDIAPGGTVAFDLTVAAEDLLWSGSYNSWGPRGLEAEAILADDTRLADRSIAVVKPNIDLTPMPAAAAIPLTQTPEELAGNTLSVEDFAEPRAEPTEEPTESAEPTADASGTAVEPTATPTDEAEAEAESDRFTQTVGLLAMPGVSLFIDPAIDSLEDPAEAIDGSDDSEMLTTPLYDADTAALVHGGHSQILEDVMADASDVALLPAGADGATIDALRDAGVEAALLSDEDIPQAGFSYATPSARTTVVTDSAEMPALAIDSAVSSALAGRLSDGSKLSTLDSQQVVLGLSALTYRERPNDPRAMVLSLDRAGLSQYGASVDDPEDAEQIAGSLETLMGASWVEPTSVSDLLELEDPETDREALAATNVSSGEITSAQVDELTGFQASVATYANLAEDPDAVLDPTKSAARSALATGLRGDGAARDRIIGGINNLANQLAGSLSVEPTSTINVISENTELPLHVSSELPFSSGVVIRVDSHDFRLVSKGDVAVSLPGDGTTDVSVPVEARGSGNVQVEVQILDPAGNVIGPSQDAQIRVRADWENVGTAVIAIGLVGILAFGIVRSLRRGKKHGPVDPTASAQAQRNRRRAVWRHGK